MLRNASFGLYLFSFCDFDAKTQEGEQLEAKTAISSHISESEFQSGTFATLIGVKIWNLGQIKV